MVRITSPVSIHAPAWGATRPYCKNRLLSPVSIHAPAWGATFDFFSPHPTSTFQSTHPRGVRPFGRCLRLYLGWFQSTHPRGVRHRDHQIPKNQQSFQSTHPRGVRRLAKRETSRRACFNPRTRVGCDYYSDSQVRSLTLFQSTHPRGVRRYLWKVCYFGAFHRYLREPVLFEDGLPANFLPVFFFPYFSTRWLCGHLVWEKVVNWRFPNGILPVFPSFFPFLQNTSGPSGSIAAFAPTCSSLFFQLAPRK